MYNDVLNYLLLLFLCCFLFFKSLVTITDNCSRVQFLHLFFLFFPPFGAWQWGKRSASSFSSRPLLRARKLNLAHSKLAGRKLSGRRSGHLCFKKVSCGRGDLSSHSSSISPYWSIRHSGCGRAGVVRTRCWGGGAGDTPASG